MIAWVCPAATVRLTPRKISRLSLPCPVTLTCRSRISRVDISLLFGNGHVYVAVVYSHLVGGQRFGSWRAGRLARAQVKARTVQPALDRVVVDLAVDQRDLLMGAEFVERVNLALAPDDHQRGTPKLNAEGALLGNLVKRACPDELRHGVLPSSPPGAPTGSLMPLPRSPPGAPTGSLMPFSSSASIAAAIRSRSSGTSISPISSPKNPLITSRRASARGMPRAIR